LFQDRPFAKVSRPLPDGGSMSALPPKADIRWLCIRFVPIADILRCSKNVVTVFKGLASPCVRLWPVVSPSIGR
jgi:hypothetical protein